MTPEVFKQEIAFGLENLERVKDDIVRFHASRAETSLRSSALAYACIGYFNALEHLMLRSLKFWNAVLPSGPSSHQMALNEFRNLLEKLNLPFPLLEAFKRLLGFRHIATKIYGFLIDLEKLDEVVASVNDTHESFVALFHEITQKA